jgi:RHS repeat-associated protein
MDPAGRVTAVTAQGWSERYAYDSLGNITHAAWPGADDAFGDREYTGTLIRRAGRVRYEHDAQERVVLREHVSLSGKVSTWHYQWDAEDRMVGVRIPDGTVWRYRYDPLGRRIAKDRLNDAGHVVERIAFAWDGATLAEQAHSVWTGTSWAMTGTVWDYEPDGFRPAAQTRRVRDASQQWIDQEFQAIVADLVGSPAELVDTLGNVMPTVRTSLWGHGPARDPAGCPLRFPGQYHDAETGLSYNVERYYDPADGRFRSPDPLGLTPQPNPHTYVRNPMAFADPLGLGPVEVQAPAGARFDHLNRPGYSNYLLVDQNGKPYYSGMYGPGDTPAGVQYRHGNNHNRFDPSQGDTMEVLPGTRSYGEARLQEQRLAEQHETIIGRDGDNYRGNRQNPLAGDKLAEYEAYGQKINGGCP